MIPARPRRTVLLAAAAAVAACACAAPRRDVGPAVPSDAGAPRSVAFVYLDPPPRELDGVRAEVGAVRFLRDDGLAVDLQVRSRVVEAPGEDRQRLLADGPVPPGRYVGIEWTVTAATLSTETGPRVLTVPGTPDRAETAIEVGAEDAVVLVVRIAPTAVGDDTGFAPRISAGPPGEIAAEAVAVGTVPQSRVLIAFHKVTGAVFRVLQTCDGPRGVAYDADLQRAYVACERDDTVESFDLLRGTREQTLPLSFGDRPRSVTLSRDGRTLVVANAGSSTVAFLEAPRLAERDRIEVAREPVAVVADPQRDTLAVVSREGNAITLVDPATARAIATVPTEESGPVHAAFDARDGRLYVIHATSPYVSVVDPSAPGVVGRAYVGDGGTSVAVDPRTGRVFVARRGEASVEIYDPASLLPIDRLRTGAPASHLAVDRRGDRLYVALADRGEIWSYRLPGADRAEKTETSAPVAWIAVGTEGVAR